MLEEIKNVVSHHFEDAKYEMNETNVVLNNLPLVISLRSEIEILKRENERLKNSLEKYDEVKNIELEILEVEKADSPHPMHFLNFPTSNSEDEHNGSDDNLGEISGEDGDKDDDESEDEDEDEVEDELALSGGVTSDTIHDENHVTGAPIEVWGLVDSKASEASNISLKGGPLVTKLSDDNIDVKKYGIVLHEDSTSFPAKYFIIKHDEKQYYTTDRDNGVLRKGMGPERVGAIIGKLENGTAFFS